MVIFGDYHTHTIYSSGKLHARHAIGTILENAMYAKKKGLKEIAITDHGFSHKAYALDKKNLPKMREEIADAEKKTNVKIYLGVEANIISSQGDIDLTPEEEKLFDIIIVGFHKMARARSTGEFFKFMLPNLLGWHDKKTINRNTMALCRAMDKHPIDIISHPGVGYAVDFDALSRVAARTNTHLEINGKRIAYNKSDIAKIVANGAKFVLSSDAHSPRRVGDLDKCYDFAIKNDCLNSIANLGKNLTLKEKE